ncbi:hypothetical protein ABZU25_02555 [Micromonospora sp. NPDC005215]|uniref:hypothetical protein n=1 Tax=Micromonospora sp. NPDC005215 TaxID=3157024 RepID=UPI0033B8F70F
MRENVIDLIVISPNTDDEDWAFHSPQIPGLVGGRSSLLQLRADLPEILRFADVPLPVQIRVHVEDVYDSAGTSYLIRQSQDGHRTERSATAQRLRAALTVAEQREQLLSSPRTRTGEVLFITAVPSDTLHDLSTQLHPSGDAAVVVCNVADELLWSFHLTNAEDLDAAARPLGDLGLSGETTIAEVMRQRPVGSPTPALLAS